MAKSIRSKRKKRLRTLKRELVADHYDKKDAAKFAALEAAAAAPRIELPQRRRDMGKGRLMNFFFQSWQLSVCTP